MYLLDTDWCIQALGHREPAASTIRDLIGMPVSVGLVTVGEIYERAFVFANPEAHLQGLRRFLASYRLLGLSEPIMEEFAETRAYLRRTGQLIADLDLLIAATALHHNLTLLTFNRRHFERIPDLNLYLPH